MYTLRCKKTGLYLKRTVPNGWHVLIYRKDLSSAFTSTPMLARAWTGKGHAETFLRRELSHKAIEGNIDSYEKSKELYKDRDYGWHGQEQYNKTIARAKELLAYNFEVVELK